MNPDLDLSKPSPARVITHRPDALADAIERNHAEVVAMARQLMDERDALKARLDNASTRCAQLRDERDAARTALEATVSIRRSLREFVAFVTAGAYDWHELPAEHNRAQILRRAQRALGVKS